MTLSQIRSQVNSLKRRLARPLAQLHLQRIAEEHCEEWYRTEVEHEPAPDPQVLILQVVRAGFLLTTFGSTSALIDRCLDKGKIPEPEDILHALLPYTNPFPLHRR